MELKKLTYALCCAYAPLAVAQTAVPVVVIENAREQAQAGVADVGTRLGLSLQETPASVQVIDRGLIEGRGARTLDEAVRGAVGVAQGGNASSPSLTSARGFTAGFISYLYDGSRISVPTMSGRTQDTWNIERVEVLSGPASVMAGDGAIGGAINFVTRRPDSRAASGEAMLSYGSFNTLRSGIDLNRPLGESSALRFDYSHQRTDGYVERNKQRYDSVSVAFSSALSAELKLDLRLDLLRDGIQSYQGTPLVPRAFAADPDGAVTDAAGRVIDRRIAFNNYNVADARTDADSRWARAKLTWDVAPGWVLSNELSWYDADRRWRNAESQVFAAPGRLTRDLVGVSHDHQVLANRFEARYRGSLAGMKHRFAAGVDYNRTRFATERRFSNGSAAANSALALDLLAPVYGSYAVFSADPSLYAGAGNRTNFATRIPTVALFAEDALWVTPQWTLVAGLRQERVKIERDNLDLNTGIVTSFAQQDRPRSFRLGTVYTLGKDTALYLQHTNASAPVGSGNLLLLSAANAAFDLSKGSQSEIGVKQTLMGGAVDYTLALYTVDLDNILSRDAAVPALTVNSGKQSSRGVELSARWRATRQLRLGGNVAVVDAQFDHLIEAGNVSRAGNLPPNVAKRIANLWLDYQLADAPLKFGAGIYHTGDRYANTANTIQLRRYTTADLYATWRMQSGELSLRVRNAGDKVYASWSGANANSQVILGAPRSAELSYRLQF